MTTDSLAMPVIVGSVRRGRHSIRVARFMQRKLESAGIEAPLLDLAEIRLPIMEERLHMRDDPPPGLRRFSQAISEADAVVVVSPEYHGSIPGVLKNALDYLRGEWDRKPVGIVTVSSGGFGGVQVHNHLQLLFLRLKAVPVAAIAVSKVAESFSEDGGAKENRYEDGFQRFLLSLLWYARAIGAAKRLDQARKPTAQALSDPWNTEAAEQEAAFGTQTAQELSAIHKHQADEAKANGEHQFARYLYRIASEWAALARYLGER